MGFLSDDFYKNLSEGYTERMQTSPGALAEQEKDKNIEVSAHPLNFFDPIREYFKVAEQPPMVPGVPRPPSEGKVPPPGFAATPIEISEEEQIKKYGGVVGSAEYIKRKLEHPYLSFLPQQLGSAIGMQFPDVYTWDKMKFADKANHVAFQTLTIPVKLALGMPAYIVKSIPSLASFVIRPIIEGTLSPEKLVASEKENPYFLSDPIYTPAYEAYLGVKEAGHSDAVATVVGYLNIGREILTRVFVSKGLIMAVKGVVVPPKKLAPGEKITKTAPIQEALTKSKAALAKEAGMVPKDGPASIYLSQAITNEAQLRSIYGVKGGRIWTKITPAGEGKVQISVVQTRGPIQAGVAWAKKKIGLEDQKFVSGMKGPERTLESTVIKIEAPKGVGKVAPTFVPKPELSGLENLKAELSVLDDTIKTHPAFSLTKYATKRKTELPEVVGLTQAEKARGVKIGEYGKRGDQIVTELGFADDAQAAAAYGELVRLRQQRVTLQASIKSESIKIGAKVDKALEQASLDKSIQLEAQIEASLGRIRGAVIKPIPDKPLIGFENIPITKMQVANLSNIGRMNGIEPAVQEILTKVWTGKSVVGELTNAQYINVAKNLATVNKLGEFGVGGEASLWSRYVGRRVSPAYSWMESVQRRTGVPIEDARIDLVNGLRFQKTVQTTYFKKIDGIWGKYAKPKYVEYQRLVDAHMRGDSGAIVNNLKLSPAVKSDLLKIVDDVQKFYKEAGPALNVPKEIFRKNEAGYYVPDIQQIGGVMPKYKEAGKIPTVGEFFAKQKKEGGMFVYEDNALKQMQIYSRSGAYAKYVKPVVDRIQTDIAPIVPAEFKNSFSSTISEMLGYQGGFERFLDNVSTILNQKLNRNLPPDLGRRVNQTIFSYAYANALNSPGTWTRNILMNDALLYVKFKGEFWVQTQAAILDKAMWKEFQKSGFSNAATNPYGADLGQIEGTVKNVTQTVLKPQSFSDNNGRYKAYVNTKLVFEDALKRYNQGKLTWAQVENKLDLNGLSPIVANRVRSQLLAKNTQAAFEELVRNNINETNFPYGRGEGGLLTFGEAGHTATFLAKWNIHFTHEIGRWIRTGQWDKLIRYYGASTAIIESLKEAVGVDFTRSFYMGPILGTSWPPSMQLGLDLIRALQTQTMDNAEAIDNSRDAIWRTVKTFGVPGGVDTKNVQAFLRSYERGPVDAQGRYNIINERGEVAEPHPVYFHDLFWRMMGMPTISKTEASQLKKDITNYQYEVNQAKRKVAELRNAGRDNQADLIVLKWEAMGEDIEPGRQSYDRFEESAAERRFEQLSPTGEAKFEERIYK